MTRKGIPAKRGKVVSNAEFRRMWETMPIREIATALRISVPAVHIRAKTRGLDRRPWIDRDRKLNTPLFRAMYSANVATAEMMAHFGASHTCIYKTAARLGLPKRPRGGRITVRQFHEQQLAARMAESARIEQQALVLSEMVDGARSRRAA